MRWAWAILLSFPFRVFALESWYNQAVDQGKDAFLWYYQSCPQLMVKFTSWTEGVKRPPMVIHSTQSPRGLQMAEIQWEVLQKFPDICRDVYFLVSCEGDALAALLQILVKPDEGFEPKFSDLEKAEHAKLRRLFPRFQDAAFVWSEGAFLDSASIEPWIWAPLGTSQRGIWLVRLESSDMAIESKVGQILERLYSQQVPRYFAFSELHFEHEQQFAAFRFMLPWRSWLLSLFNPREFFFWKGWQNDLTHRWSLISLRDNEAVLQLEFLGGREQDEVEAGFRQVLSSFGGLHYQSIYFRHFIRSPIYGRDMEAFQRVLNRLPQVKAVPFISGVESSAYLFRRKGMTTIEFSGLYSRYDPQTRKSHQNFSEFRSRAIQIHSELMSDLVH